MKWPFTIREILYTFVMGYLIFDNITNWDAYNKCRAPIQLFLTMDFSALLATTLLVKLINAPDLPRWAYKGLTAFLSWILTPFIVYVFIQGMIWQIENMAESPDCVPLERLPLMTWAWLLITALFAILLSFLTFLRLRNWIRIRMFRRRMARFQELIASGNYEALNQLLLGQSDMNNRVGLMPHDFARLETQEYSQSLTQMFKFSHLESCPICFEDYKNGDRITVLPKCNHTFHPQCIGGWLTKSPLCPMCRANVRTNLYNVSEGPGTSDPNSHQDLENPLIRSN